MPQKEVKVIATMPHIRKICVFFCAAFISYANQAHAQTPQKTDKIKITSAYNIDGDWIFNLFDRTNQKAIKLFNYQANSGFRILNFNEETQTATLSTPQGVFILSLQKISPTETQGNNKQASQEELDFSKITSDTAPHKRILDNIK